MLPRQRERDCQRERLSAVAGTLTFLESYADSDEGARL